jgi:hypothetical protein
MWFLFAVVLTAVFLRVSLPASFHKGFVIVGWICLICAVLAYVTWTILIRRGGSASARNFRNALNKMLCKELLGSDATARDILMADVNTGLLCVMSLTRFVGKSLSVLLLI